MKLCCPTTGRPRRRRPRQKNYPKLAVSCYISAWSDNAVRSTMNQIIEQFACTMLGSQALCNCHHDGLGSFKLVALRSTRPAWKVDKTMNSGLGAPGLVTLVTDRIVLQVGDSTVLIKCCQAKGHASVQMSETTGPWPPPHRYFIAVVC